LKAHTSCLAVNGEGDMEGLAWGKDTEEEERKTLDEEKRGNGEEHGEKNLLSTKEWPEIKNFPIGKKRGKRASLKRGSNLYI